MRRATAALALVLLLAGCGSDDPCAGVWQLTIQWGGGDCGYGGTTTYRIDVGGGSDLSIASSASLELGDTVSGAAITGNVSDTCVLSATAIATEVQMDGNPLVQTAVFDVTAVDSVLSGAGHIEEAYGGSACQQSFTVSGMLL